MRLMDARIHRANDDDGCGFGTWLHRDGRSDICDSTSTGVAARAIEANLHDIEQNRLAAQGSMPSCIRIELGYQ